MARTPRVLPRCRPRRQQNGPIARVTGAVTRRESLALRGVGVGCAPDASSDAGPSAMLARVAALVFLLASAAASGALLVRRAPEATDCPDAAALSAMILKLTPKAPEAADVAPAEGDRFEVEFSRRFVLFELEGMSGIDIAELVDIPIGTVHSRLRLAREGFRRAVARVNAHDRFHLVEGP